ncbi:MAG: GGDEF domain-containing protein [Alphaproteobacteria bacterium]|nr:GGDEF domain-containing protein [Alphaproteobacteria bacterium]
MIENFDDITDDLENNGALDNVLKNVPLNLDEAKEYNIDLDSLEAAYHKKAPEKQEKNENNDWYNLDVRFIEIVNSFISTSERPVFFIRDDKLVYMNQAALLFFDIGVDKDFIGSNFFNLVVKEDWSLLSESIGEMITNGKDVKIRIKNAKGKITPVVLRAIYLSESDHFSFILMGEHKKQKSKLFYSNLYDETTGLPTFFLFEDRVQVAVSDENNKDNAKDVGFIAVIALNIDNIESFRKMHIDEVIINKIANSLVLNLPKNTTLGVGLKYNFWIMLKLKNKNELDEHLDRILSVLKEGVSDNFTRHDLLFSMGVSYFPQKSRSSKKLMEQAIRALEKNQSNHKNLYEIFNEDKI